MESRITLELGDVIRVGNGGCWFVARSRKATSTYVENPGHEFECMCTRNPRSANAKELGHISVFGPVQGDSWAKIIVRGVADFDAAVAATALLV